MIERMVSPLCYYENGIFHSAFLKKLFDNVRNTCLKKSALSVMDIGCGSGRLLLNDVVPLLPTNFSEVIGVDKYHSMIGYCKTVNEDSRISFEQLDITTKELPKKFVERFDLITSFFCLHYVNDYNQMIRNIREMLKPKGEFLYIQPYNLNPLYDSYRELCKIGSWEPVLKDFKNYAAPFSESDRESKLEDMYRRNGLKLFKYRFAGLPFKIIPKKFKAYIQALDTFENIIPKDQKEAYKKDFHKIFYEVVRLDHLSEENLANEAEICLDCLTVHAQKQ